METTVLLVDDHPVFRKGLRLLLEEEGDMRVAVEAGDGQTAIDLVRELTPDVVIMDITMPKLSGVDATRHILSESPNTKIIALSIHGEKRFIERMLQAGAAGYLLKDSIPEELVNGVRAVMRGEVVLSAAVAGVVVSEYRQALSSAQASGELEDRTAASPIILTKLHRPRATPELVSRPHLLARLEQGLQRPLTLVSASAGFGKSTLLADWLETCDRPSAWLQLDAEDSDLVVFLRYLLAAVQTLFPDVGGRTQALLEGATRPPMPAIVKTLINELDQIKAPFILVLDDYHTIQDEPVHELLDALISRLPPLMHLAIATRTNPPLPLTGLRARGQVLEIRTEDLRFTPEEAHIFLEGMLGRELSRETTDLLGTKTEGWVVGLRLAALSMRGLPDVEAFVQRFDGTSSPYVADYLLGEVLARQSPAVQEFLLQTSILDRFCAPLCDVVCSSVAGTDYVSIGEASSSGAAVSAEGPVPDSGRVGSLLDELNRANLFLVSLDTEGRWYRYHHLFADLLRHRLAREHGPDEIATLHARASAWFANNGLIDEALDHALAAGDVAGAAQIVEKNRTVVLVNDEWHVLARWLDRLPGEIKQQRPELQLAQAWVFFHLLDFQDLPSILEDVERALVGDGSSDPLQGEIDFFRGYFSYFQALGPQAEKYLASATEKIPEAYHHVRGEAELHYALAVHMAGRKEMAVDRLTDLIHSKRLGKGISRTRLWAGLLFIHLLEGNLREAIYPAQQVQDTASQDKIRYAETGAPTSRRAYTFAGMTWNLRSSSSNSLQPSPTSCTPERPSIAFAH